jgi:hypothetical protein
MTLLAEILPDTARALGMGALVVTVTIFTLLATFRP